MAFTNAATGGEKATDLYNIYRSYGVKRRDVDMCGHGSCNGDSLVSLSLSLFLSLSLSLSQPQRVVYIVQCMYVWTVRGKRMNGDNVSVAIECRYVNSVLHVVQSVKMLVQSTASRKRVIEFQLGVCMYCKRTSQPASQPLWSYHYFPFVFLFFPLQKPRERGEL